MSPGLRITIEGVDNGFLIEGQIPISNKLNEKATFRDINEIRKIAGTEREALAIVEEIFIAAEEAN